MRYLNLTKGFNPYKVSKEEEVPFETFVFNGGEPHIRIKHIPFNVGTIRVSIQINTYNDLGLLKVAVDALKRSNPGTKIEVFIPYFPGARQDRICNEGEAYTSAIYVKEIASMGVNKVTSFDLHSDVIGAMFAMTNVHFIAQNNHSLVISALATEYPSVNDEAPIIISPNAEANKKIGALAKYLSTFNKVEVVKCDKTRDLKTSEITNFEIYAEDFQGKDCILVDDICDGGGTFLGLAKELKARNCGRLILIVSHGIFSQGLEKLTEVFDAIYTTDSFNGPRDHERVIEIPTNAHRDS